ncbi:MAG: sulfotransferase [Planctomycetota bacterium]
MKMVPDFLIVGGMKCGSTTIYRDLLTQPGIFFPQDKEPELLCSPDALTPDGRAAFAALFAAAKPTDRCGEASTAYTKRPVHEGAAERAAALNPECRIIYAVREPVARIESHHHHARLEGNADPDFGRALDESSDLFDFTRYAWQIRPWLDAFGPDRVRILRFEDHVANRGGSTASLARFIGVEAAEDRVDAERVFNRSEGKPQVRGAWRSIQGNPLYVRLVRPMLSPAVREKIRQAVLPKARVPKSRATPEQVDRIYDVLRTDLDELARILGLGDGEAVWSREAAVRRAEEHAQTPSGNG